jgi:hypothetical protein
MTLPVEVKMALERKALSLGVSIVGVHSVVLVENTVDVIYDVEPDENGSGLHFQFPLPQLVSAGDLSAFAVWLAARHVGTVH